MSLVSFSFIQQLRDIRESVYDIRMNVAQFYFSPHCREMFACFLKTVARLSYDIHTIVAKFWYCKLPKFRGDRFATLARRSYDFRTTVL